MTRRPHVRRDEPEPEEPFALALLGIAAIVVLGVLLFVVLPVMAGM